MYLLRQYTYQDIVVQAAEAVGDVALNKPGDPGPGFAYLPQCGVTPSPFPEAVRPVRENRLVIRLQEEAHHFADQFIGPRRHTERAKLPVFLRDPGAARRREPVPLAAHQLNDLADLALGHAVSSFPADPRRHRTLVGVDAAVGQQEQVPVEHLPVKLRARQALPAALAENAQYHCGFLHYAYLMAFIRSFACAPSPCGPLLAVSRLGGRYPADYYGHSVTLGLASLRPSHVHNCCTYRARFRRPVRLLQYPDRASLLHPRGLRRASRQLV